MYAENRSIFAKWKKAYKTPEFAYYRGGGTHTVAEDGRCYVLYVDYKTAAASFSKASMVQLNGTDQTAIYTSGTSSARAHYRTFSFDVKAGDEISIKKYNTTTGLVCVMPSYNSELDSIHKHATYSLTSTTQTYNLSYTYTATEDCCVAVLMNKQFIDAKLASFSHSVKINGEVASADNVSDFYTADNGYFSNVINHSYKWYAFRIKAGDTITVEINSSTNATSNLGWSMFNAIVYK